jgi:BirA family biotin operon repressor/biotin-[acetyl-CoA-carboxylase] ligase
MATPPGWDAEQLWLDLAPVCPGISIEVLPEVASTNTLLLQRTADPLPCLLVAEHQTQGRGRMGRQWLSAPGASLTFSLALPLSPARWEGLSLAVGLALAQALDPVQEGQPPRVLLKWPNDLWLADPARVGRKLGGVLIETAQRGSQRLCVVGVGLNIRALPPQDAPPPAGPGALAHGHASLQELCPGIDAQQALARVALPLALALRSFESAGFAPLRRAYAARDLLQGRAVSTSATPALQGVAQGVDDEGALQVLADSQMHRVHSGEVSVRLQPPGQGQPLAEAAG